MTVCTVCLEVIHFEAIEASNVSAFANDHATLTYEETTVLAWASATSQFLSATVSAVRWLLTRLPSGGNTFHEGPSEFEFLCTCLTACLTKLAVPFPPSATTFTGFHTVITMTGVVRASTSRLYGTNNVIWRLRHDLRCFIDGLRTYLLASARGRR